LNNFTCLAHVYLDYAEAAEELDKSTDSSQPQMDPFKSLAEIQKRSCPTPKKVILVDPIPNSIVEFNVDEFLNSDSYDFRSKALELREKLDHK
jgi:hypothetical protein